MLSRSPHIRRGGLRLLALTSAKRIALLPEVPTVAEAGFPGYEAGNWYGMVVPAKTPAAPIAALRSAALAAIGSADITRRFADLGYVAVGDAPDEFAAHMKNEIDSLTKTFRALGVKID